MDKLEVNSSALGSSAFEGRSPDNFTSTIEMQNLKRNYI